MLSLETMSSLKKLDEVYDYYFASGIYNLGIKKETQEAFVNDFKSIIKITERACGVNFLSSTSKNQDNISVYHEPSEIINLVENQLFCEYETFENYLPNDFTILIWK